MDFEQRMYELWTLFPSILIHKGIFPVNTKHFYNIYAMLAQRQRRWADVV